MNPDLIRQYATGASEEGIQNLITLFEAIISQRDRAEMSVNIHIHTIKKLHESFKNITEPKTYVGSSKSIPSLPRQNNEHSPSAARQNNERTKNRTKISETIEDLEL